MDKLQGVEWQALVQSDLAVSTIRSIEKRAAISAQVRSVLLQVAWYRFGLPLLFMLRGGRTSDYTLARWIASPKSLPNPAVAEYLPIKTLRLSVPYAGPNI